MIGVFIDGSAGTTGLRIRERLSARRDLRLITLPEERRKDVSARRDAINAADVVFLCLPDDAAREAVSLVENPGTVVIDASTAHRTEEGWAYGFPELSREHFEGIRTGKRIADPGCHASGFLAIAYPLVREGILSCEYPFVCHSVTGYTGGGKRMIEAYEDPGRDPLLDAPRVYGLGQTHKHLPEMTKVAGLTRAPAFLPVVSDFDCGMCVSVPIFGDLMQKPMGVNDVFDFFTEYYARHNTIQITKNSEDGFLSAKKYRGYDGMEIFVGGNDERLLLIARFDNLGKGASGAAIQNMNIATMLDETVSLVL